MFLPPSDFYFCKWGVVEVGGLTVLMVSPDSRPVLGGGGFFTSPTRSGVFGLTLCEGERGITYTKKLLLAPGSLANGYKSSVCSTHCSNVCMDYLRFFSDDFLKVTWHF